MTTAAGADRSPDHESGRREYRIDELARAAGTTVRNVRAYQDRGLLPPPRRDGRVAWYSDAHVARLRLVGQLLERGYTLANIRELLGAWETGQNVGELLGLEAALAEPWSDETPITMTAAELASVFGDAFADPGGIERALELGVLEVRGDEFVVRKPRMLQVGAELVAAGIPLSAVLALGQKLRSDIDRVAVAFVDLVSTYVFAPVGEPIPSDEVPRLTEIVRRLRPLAKEAVDAELADAMERHVAMELRHRLGRILAGLQPPGEAS
jgi:DNA-binding transcriptional MerR regulator